MRIGVPPESSPGETRVAATPATVAQLTALGYEVLVESGAGAPPAFPDEAYAAAGARVGTADDASAPTSSSSQPPVRPTRSPRCATARSWSACCAGAAARSCVEALAARPVTALAMDAVPRISPGAVAGRAELDGQHRRLPRGHRGGPRVRPALHRPGHRGRQGPAGQGPRRRRRGGRPGGDRHGRQPRRRRPGDRRRGPRWPSRSRSLGGEFLGVARTPDERGVRPDGYATATARRLRPAGGRALRRAGRATSTS